MNGKRFLFLILLSIFTLLFLSGCAAVPPVDVILEKYPHIAPQIADETVTVYFPSFTGSSYSQENKKVIGGDGSIIILPNGQVMIVDGFYAEAAEQYISFIKSLGINHIDYLVLTHFHGDHAGSLPALIEAFHIEYIYTNGAYTNSSPTQNIRKAIEENGVQEVIISEGDTFSLGGCEITVYSPSLSEQEKYDIFYNPGKTAKKINDSSLVFKLQYEDFSILFSGDIYKDVDRKLVRKYGDELQSTILKLPHHGEFYTANSLAFAEAVRPEYGIVMDNRYVSTMGSVVSNRYALSGGKILFRDDAGYICIQSDGVEYSLSAVAF